MSEAYTLLNIESTIDHWLKVVSQKCTTTESYLDQFLFMSQSNRTKLIGNLLALALHCSNENSLLVKATDKIKDILLPILDLANTERDERFSRIDSLVIFFLEHFEDDLINSELKELTKMAEFVLRSSLIKRNNTPAIFEVLDDIRFNQKTVDLINCDVRMVV